MTFRAIEMFHFIASNLQMLRCSNAHLFRCWPLKNHQILHKKTIQDNWVFLYGNKNGFRGQSPPP